MTSFTLALAGLMAISALFSGLLVLIALIYKGILRLSKRRRYVKTPYKVSYKTPIKNQSPSRITSSYHKIKPLHKTVPSETHRYRHRTRHPARFGHRHRANPHGRSSFRNRPRP